MQRWLRRQDELENGAEIALLGMAGGSVEPRMRKMAIAGLAKLSPRDRIDKAIILERFLVALQDIAPEVRQAARKAIRAMKGLTARDLRKIEKAEAGESKAPR